MSLRFNRFFKELVNVQKERGLLNIPPLPLNIDHTVTLCDILENNEYDEEKSAFLLEQLKYRIVPGVDETSYISNVKVDDSRGLWRYPGDRATYRKNGIMDRNAGIVRCR